MKLFRPTFAVLLCPVVWLIGLTPIYYHLVSLVGGRGVKYKSTVETNLILLISAIYFLSIFLGSLDGASTERVIAAIYTWSFWPLGFLLIMSRGKIFPSEISKYSRFVFYLLVVSTISLVGFFVKEPYSFPTLIKYFLGGYTLPPVLNAQLIAGISDIDYSIFSDFSLRPKLLAPYTMSHAPTMFLLMCLAVPLKKSPKHFFLYFIMSILCLASVVFLAKTRSTFLAMFIYFSIMIYFFLVNNLKDRRAKISLAAFVFTAIILIMFFSGTMEDLYLEIYKFRGGSSTRRLWLYTLGISLVFENHPIVGYGIKNVEDVSGFHSTFVNLFFRSGIIGIGAFVSLILIVSLKSIKILSRKMSSLFLKSVCAGQISMILVLAVDDIEANPLMCFLFFIVVSIIIFENERMIESKKIMY